MPSKGTDSHQSLKKAEFSLKKTGFSTAGIIITVIDTAQRIKKQNAFPIVTKCFSEF
jgi:2C-methyl-D-erythritol 2,4-cyclodiphosphate synthase